MVAIILCAVLLIVGIVVVVVVVVVIVVVVVVVVFNVLANQMLPMQSAMMHDTDQGRCDDSMYFKQTSRSLNCNVSKQGRRITCDNIRDLSLWTLRSLAVSRK